MAIKNSEVSYESVIYNFVQTLVTISSKDPTRDNASNSLYKHGSKSINYNHVILGSFINLALSQYVIVRQYELGFSVVVIDKIWQTLAINANRETNKRRKKVQIGNDQEMAQSERNSHSINRGVGKNLNDT